MDNNGKEWKILEKVALESFKEQKRSRRWGIFFKLLTFIYLFVAFGLVVSSGSDLSKAAGSNEPHTAVVRVHGPIMDDFEASAGMINQGLRDAFENKNSKAVLLAVNSPGGSPVHAGYVYDEIMRLKQLYPGKKVYAVISDLGASAAYYISAAADEIYADKASLVGSIGVISASFGFTEAMEKVGVERRVFTSGDHKAFLDPYQPLKEEDKIFWQESLDVIHQQFIEQVKNGRGDRLKIEKNTFSGYIWTGEQALANGLVDGLGSARFVAREIVGAEELVDYSMQKNPLDEFMKRLGVEAAKALYYQLSVSSQQPSLH
jgi:protease-4